MEAKVEKRKIEKGQDKKEIFSKIPYSARVVLLPQCLRSNLCKAPRRKYGVIQCEACGQNREDGLPCPIPKMVSIAKEIGYGDVYILTGGRGIDSLLKEEGLPEAVLATACRPEVEEGKEVMDKLGIPYQVEYLIEDGCAETRFLKDQDDLENEWRKILTKFSPSKG